MTWRELRDEQPSNVSRWCNIPGSDLRFPFPSRNAPPLPGKSVKCFPDESHGRPQVQGRAFARPFRLPLCFLSLYLNLYPSLSLAR
jgi:hypothetical protein